MHSLSGTMPRQHHPIVSMSGLSLIPQPSYIGGPSTMMGHPTLRRQSSHDMDQNMPRILSRNAANVQYYYGWQTSPMLLSPAISQPPMFPSVICSVASSMRPMNISASSTQPLSITTTANSETQATATYNNTTASGESGVGANRTYCF